MVRDQYQGGSTVMSAISGVEIAMWDLIGKICGQPVWRLIGGRARDSVGAYANGWYAGCRSPAEFASRAARVVARGYTAIKFDPFATALGRWSRHSAKDGREPSLPRQSPMSCRGRE
jgi:galactonate dehydratase